MPVDRYEKVRKDIKLIEGAVIRTSDGLPITGGGNTGDVAGTLYIGAKARLVPTGSGCQLQIGGAGAWAEAQGWPA